MSSEMDEILEIFFQECDEQLQELEAGLSAIAADRAEPDTVNAVFRAVHSIKGGAASFGLQNLVRFSHVYENSLDGVRSDRISPTREVIAAFLKSMDVLSDLVVEARGGETVDAQRVNEALHELKVVNGEISADSAGDQDHATVDTVADQFCPVPFEFEPVAFDFGDPIEATTAKTQIVTFHPHDAMYGCGDDARNILVALSTLAQEKGETAQIECVTEKLPALEELAPETSYLSWRVTLPESVGEAEIREAFDWVVDSCDFTITQSDASETPPSSDAAEAVSADTASTPSSIEDVHAGQAIASNQAREIASRATSLAADVRASTERALEELGVPTSAFKEDEPTVLTGATVARKAEAASIRVDLSRVDDLMDLVGELVIAQAAVQSLCQKTGVSGHHDLMQSIEGMQTLTRDIQDAVMSVRAQPVRSVFQRMQRVVREASSMTQKAVTLVLEGEDTEVDRTLIEKLAAPLTHMLRNAVDHGIEKTEARLAAGKPAEGCITLSAEHRSGRILITIKDDGAGVNHKRVFETAVKRGIIAPDAVLSEDEINNLIFTAGFSTASEVSDLSGRGVGMDVVKQAIMSWAVVSSSAVCLAGAALSASACH